MPNYRVIHRTHYIYEEPAKLSYNEARLIPRSFSHPLFVQSCLGYKIDVEPPWSDQRERVDFFGNRVLFFTIHRPHQQARITAISHVQIEPAQAAGQPLSAPELLISGESMWEKARWRLQMELEPEILAARQFTLNSPLIFTFPELVEYAAPSFPPGRPILEAAYDLMQRIYDDFDFMPGATTASTPLADALRKRQGVCQDYAQVMIGCLRAQGLAARYVSGYIETLPSPGQAKLVGADASHAWCSLFVPDMGWIDFDPTNNLLPGDQHITLGWGRDFSDVTPLKGVFFSTGRHRLEVSVDVIRQEERPPTLLS
jgi:transglutaminase-like putative cysteine protease